MEPYAPDSAEIFCFSASPSARSYNKRIYATHLRCLPLVLLKEILRRRISYIRERYTPARGQMRKELSAVLNILEPIFQREFCFGEFFAEVGGMRQLRNPIVLNDGQVQTSGIFAFNRV